jgi:hypothetical protein
MFASTIVPTGLASDACAAPASASATVIAVKVTALSKRII